MRPDKKQIEVAIQGIDDFISRNRCSISNEDVVLLKECVTILKEYLKTDDSSKMLKKYTEVAFLLLKIFRLATLFKDLLS